MKKIAYVTGSRAEYGIVKRLLKKWQEDPQIDFSLLVTAMHLDPQYGNTVRVIEQDGFSIAECIPIQLNSQNNQTIIASMAECLNKFGAHFQEHHYDAVVVLGDRYEMLAVAIAAAMHNLSIVHLHGGEQTLGNYDEFIRHSITKMAKLHLTSTEVYRQRVIQMGEPPESVHNIGALGAENGLNLALPTREVLFEQLGISDKPYYVVVFHPETLSHISVLEQLEELLIALETIPANQQCVFIGANADTYSDLLLARTQEYAQEHHYPFFTSVKPEQYLALIKYSQGIIGNSSSGLLEAPTFAVGTINIGNRQQGRVRGESVIDVACERTQIKQALEHLQSMDFQQRLPSMINPYYQAQSMEKAYQLINGFIHSANKDQAKIFYDIGTFVK